MKKKRLSSAAAAFTHARHIKLLQTPIVPTTFLMTVFINRINKTTVTRTERGLRTCFFFFFLLISYIKNNINCKKKQFEFIFDRIYVQTGTARLHLDV